MPHMYLNELIYVATVYDKIKVLMCIQMLVTYTFSFINLTVYVDFHIGAIPNIPTEGIFCVYQPMCELFC